jgi:hypothetical protein
VSRETDKIGERRTHSVVVVVVILVAGESEREEAAGRRGEERGGLKGKEEKVAEEERARERRGETDREMQGRGGGALMAARGKLPSYMILLVCAFAAIALVGFQTLKECRAVAALFLAKENEIERLNNQHEVSFFCQVFLSLSLSHRLAAIAPWRERAQAARFP